MADKSNLQSDEILRTEQVEKDIQCKDCIYRDDGTVWSRPYTKGSCQQYPYPGSKPLGVMFKTAKCPKYKKEK